MADVACDKQLEECSFDKPKCLNLSTCTACDVVQPKFSLHQDQQEKVLCTHCIWQRALPSVFQTDSNCNSNSDISKRKPTLKEEHQLQQHCNPRMH